MKLSTKMKAGAAAIAGSAIAASGASALTSTFTLSVEFFDPFTINEDTPADMGRLISGVATTYSMAALSDAVVAGAGGSGTGGTPANGTFTISDSSTGGNVDITVNNPVANGGVTITAFDCDWNASAATGNGATCAIANQANPAGGGDVLDIGFTINVTGTQVSLDTATPTYDVTVAYN